MRRITVLVFVVGLITAVWAPVSAQERAEERVGLRVARRDGLGRRNRLDLRVTLLQAAALSADGLSADEIESCWLPSSPTDGGLAEVELRFNALDAAGSLRLRPQDLPSLPRTPMSVS